MTARLLGFMLAQTDALSFCLTFPIMARRERAEPACGGSVFIGRLGVTSSLPCWPIASLNNPSLPRVVVAVRWEQAGFLGPAEIRLINFRYILGGTLETGYGTLAMLHQGIAKRGGKIDQVIGVAMNNFDNVRVLAVSMAGRTLFSEVVPVLIGHWNPARLEMSNDFLSLAYSVGQARSGILN